MTPEPRKPFLRLVVLLSCLLPTCDLSASQDADDSTTAPAQAAGPGEGLKSDPGDKSETGEEDDELIDQARR
jgi:hypothetical protein